MRQSIMLKSINKNLTLILFLLIMLPFNTFSAPKSSTVVITRLGTNLDDGKLFVFINGKNINKKQPIGKSQSRSIDVSNGNHRIFVKVDNIVSNTIHFTANDNTIRITASGQRSGGARVLILERENDSAGTISSAPAIADPGSIHRTESANVVGIDSKKLDSAILKVSNSLAGKMPRGTTIAVLSISADKSISEYVIGELEFNLVNTGRFKIVDRRGLEQIRTEQNFQISGDVSDDSAVSIGNMLGANIVLTGEITTAGSNHRLLVKALDVQTTQIIAMEREPI